MSVDLSPEVERRISDAVAAGRFQTAEDLVETAVSRLLEFGSESNILSLDNAWLLYDRFFRDVRVVFVAEPPDACRFRERAIGKHASPKVPGDAWLLASQTPAEENR
jgi:Arc/MetJ-type ribon-helix-helix transcriptional regulator